MALSVGDPVPDALLQAEGDREVRLPELCRGAPVVLIFLRHFG